MWEQKSWKCLNEREKKEERKEVGEAWQKDDYSPSAELIYLVAASVDSFTDKSKPEFLVFCY